MYPCLHVSKFPCFHVSMSPCLHVSMSPCLHVTMSPCLHVSMSPCPHVSMSPCLHVTMSPCPHVPMFPCSRVPMFPCPRVPMSLYLHVSMSMSPCFRNSARGNWQLRFIFCKRKTVTENQRRTLFALVGKRLTVIEDCGFSKRVYLCKPPCRIIDQVNIHSTVLCWLCSLYTNEHCTQYERKKIMSYTLSLNMFTVKYYCTAPAWITGVSMKYANIIMLNWALFYTWNRILRMVNLSPTERLENARHSSTGQLLACRAAAREFWILPICSNPFL
jgi:hypothetical protein